MPKFVWASLATGALTLAAVVAHMIPLWLGAYSSYRIEMLPLFSDIAPMLLLASGIVFMFWLWQTPNHA